MLSYSNALRVALVAFCISSVLIACDEIDGTTAQQTAPAQEAASAQEASPAPAAPDVAVLSAKDIRAKIDAAKGTVAVVNFWATWCPPCVKETPELIEFYNKHHGKGVTFLSLSVDHPTTVEKAVVPFAKEKKLPFPVYVVDEANPDAISEAVGLDVVGGAVPVTWIVDAKGTPVKSFLGEVTAKILEDAITPLMAANAAAEDSDLN